MIGNDWDEVLKEYFLSRDFERTMEQVKYEYSKYECYPSFDNIFSAFRDTPFSEVKVVILGQDPYYSMPMADGHAFSVFTKHYPPSLVNIFKCLKNDYPDITIKSGDLTCWAKQGVLLLNTALSVRKGMATSHINFGWDKLIDIVLRKINDKGGVVFMLWGSKAQNLMRNLPRNRNNLYLTAVHPSPLSVHLGFLTCGHFKKCNDFLNEKIDFNVK